MTIESGDPARTPTADERSAPAQTLEEAIDYNEWLMDVLFGPVTEEQLRRFEEHGPTLLKYEPIPLSEYGKPVKDQKP